MLRKLHSLPGLFAALLLAIVAVTGAVLSVFPALERAQAVDAAGVDVATLAARVNERVSGFETLVRQPSGTLVAYHVVGEEQRASIVDPRTGDVIAEVGTSPTQRWVKNLHRKLLVGDVGRMVVGAVAACMLLIAISGVFLLARRMGGWRRLFVPVRGDTLQKLHDETARVAVFGLVLSAQTGLVMSLVTFGLIPEGGDAPFPDVRASSVTTIALERMPALQGIDVDRLQQLKLASPADPADVIEVETVDGSGAIDPATGTWLAYAGLDGWQRLHATVRMLHTGEGLWWLGLLLGACSLAVPLLGVTGTLLWWRRRAALPRLAANAPAQEADTVLLVGSEGNTTWGFAAALHDALTRAGLRVHTAPMNGIAACYRSARRLLVLTSTYGDGEAPDSARAFLDKLERMAPHREVPPPQPSPSGGGSGTPSPSGERPEWGRWMLPTQIFRNRTTQPTSPTNHDLSFAVLGFGDRQFPQFCAYAQQVHEALVASGHAPLRAPGTVDRQSEPEFRQWCEWLGQTLGVALDVRYAPRWPRTTPLQLVSRTDYGTGPETLTAVLRFAPALRAGGRRAWRGGLPAYETGDLLGVVPPDGSAPRYYSLASASRDGVVEICVRRHPHGVCSGYLTNLQPGATIEAFVRPHERFRPAAGTAPVVLVGAGTGIGPLVGFIRHNPPQRPMHLYFGARAADDGFLYGDELQDLVADRRLRTLATAFSRSADRVYVQDRLLADAPRLRQLVAQGGQVLVCGGRRMAEGVAAAWERILADSGLTVAQLRAQGRYVEDVY